MPISVHLYLRVAGIAVALLGAGGAVAVWQLGAIRWLDWAGTALCALLLAYVFHLRVWVRNQRDERSPPGGSEPRSRRALRRACALSLAVVFATAGSYKLWNLSEAMPSLLSTIASWAPSGSSQIVVGALPFFELLLALLFLRRSSWPVACDLALVLLLVFTVGLAIGYEEGVLVRGCDCNWPALRFLAPERLHWMLLRNVALIAMVLLTLPRRARPA